MELIAETKLHKTHVPKTEVKKRQTNHIEHNRYGKIGGKKGMLKAYLQTSIRGCVSPDFLP